MSEKITLTQKQDVDIKIDVYCSSCNKSLEFTSEYDTEYNKGNILTINVKPCNDCIVDAYNDGKAEGIKAKKRGER